MSLMFDGPSDTANCRDCGRLVTFSMMVPERHLKDALCSRCLGDRMRKPKKGMMVDHPIWQFYACMAIAAFLGFLGGAMMASAPSTTSSECECVIR